MPTEPSLRTNVFLLYEVFAAFGVMNEIPLRKMSSDPSAAKLSAVFVLGSYPNEMVLLLPTAASPICSTRYAEEYWKFVPLSAKIELLLALVTLTCDLTSNTAPGFVVPMPTLPVFNIDIAVTALVPYKSRRVVPAGMYHCHC